MSNKLLDELGLRAYLFVMGGGRPEQALRAPPAQTAGPAAPRWPHVRREDVSREPEPAQVTKRSFD